MKQISLSQGLFAIVDDEDFHYLNSMRWHAVKMGTKTRPLFYAVRNITIAKYKGRLQLMHRIIMQAPVGLVIDHINHNTLDNRKANLRICTQGENMKNMRSSPNKHGYRGISKTSPNTFIASIRIGRKSKYLGNFPSAEQAARAYDDAAIQRYGKFANLNFPETAPAARQLAYEHWRI